MTLRNLLLICLVPLVGCTNDDPLSEQKHVAGWANSSSALGVFAIGYEPLGVADGVHQFDDPTCPATSDDGTTVTIRGGCKDSKGTNWAGTATVVRDGAARHITLDGYGNDAILGMERTTGRFDVTEIDSTTHMFDVNVRRSGGIETTVEYTGTVKGAYQGRTVWNGSGHITRDGITINSGSIDAVTVDAVRDDAVCGGQGASGTTTLTSAEHEVVIAYDGATDCDPDAAAHWMRDGKDMGVITGISCSTGGGAGFGVIGFALALVLRRRQRRSRSAH
jgi:MYXO-CTERM domain-containing protein